MADGMFDSQQQRHPQLCARLIQLITMERASIAYAWSESIGTAADTFREQADRLLDTLADGLARPPGTERRVTFAQDAALQQTFPEVYRISTLLALAALLTERLAESDSLPSMEGEGASLPIVFEMIQEGLAAMPESSLSSAFTERLAQLSQISVMLGRLRDQDAIMELALAEAPRLVGAESGALWLWDADQQAPVMLKTPQATEAPPTLPPHLMQLFRQAGACAFSVDCGESEESWPCPLAKCTVAFIPLPDEQGCRGILTVHARTGWTFTTDDILLLSSLGNLVSAALQNAQLHEKEHQLVNLLQSSISRLVQATSNPLGQREGFIQSLLQVAEGLTRAEAVGASVAVDSATNVVVTATGMAAPLEPVLRLTRNAYGRMPEHLPASSGFVSALAGDELDSALRGLHYSSAPIRLGGRAAGGILALSDAPLSDEQTAFLHTIAGLVGVGVANMEQASSNAVLLVQLNDLLGYFTDVITRQLSEHEDAAREIMKITAEKIARAADMPISICGWAAEDGTIRVWPGATVGIPAELEAKLVEKTTDHDAQLPLTVNNRVIRTALTQQQPQTRGREGPNARPAFRWLSELGVDDWICMPMIVQKNAKGIALLADTVPHLLSSREIALLSTYANQAALALENSLLNEARRRTLEQTEKLYEYTSSISANLVINEILKKVMQSARDIQRAQSALVTLSVEDSLQQRAVLNQGFSRPVAGNILFPDDGIIGTAARRRRPVESTNLPSDGRDPILRAMAGEEGFTSSVTVPVMAHLRGALLGTLTVFSRPVREFTAEEVDLLRTIASQAAVAIQNAQALVQEKQHTRELQSLVRQFTRQVPSRLLELTLELLQIAHNEDSAPEALARTRRRLECMLLVQQEISDETAGSLNVKAALDRLASERMMQAAEIVPEQRIRVLGAAAILPWRQAIMLGLFVHEWLLAAEKYSPANGLRMDVMFQRAGEEILVQLDDNAGWDEHAAAPSPGILALIQQALNGSLSETIENDIHRVRYRFSFEL